MAPGLEPNVGGVDSGSSGSLRFTEPVIDSSLLQDGPGDPLISGVLYWANIAKNSLLHGGQNRAK